MDVYQVDANNTELTGEHRRYLVQAQNVGDAEIKALKKMDQELKGERGQNYVQSVTLLGSLTK